MPQAVLMARRGSQRQMMTSPIQNVAPGMSAKKWPNPDVQTREYLMQQCNLSKCLCVNQGCLYDMTQVCQEFDRIESISTLPRGSETCLRSPPAG